MSSLLSLIVLSCVIITCYSAVFLERQLEISGRENECYDKDNTFYKKGEHMKWSMKICGQKTCRGSAGRGRVYAETQTCGKISVSPECHVEVNLRLPYPKCCGKVVCPEIFNIKNSTI